MAITPFKLIQGNRFWYAICEFLLVINTNLPRILPRFPIMADHMSNFR